ncbi:MAG: AAA family ATPase [Candidatus Alcyoniella australis]|nr:AAA family ATPase [Candidatus Alcyoniella australis]
MRIDRLVINNFKGFKHRELSFHPEFNLVVGDNGLGKTSVLEALSIAAGSWFLGLRGYDTRHIKAGEARLEGFITADGVNWEHQYPCIVEAHGRILGNDLTWKRSLNYTGGRTSYGDARSIKDLASESDEKVRAGEPISLPIISYYSTARLWDVPREQARVKSSKKIKEKAGLSRLDAYRNSVDPRLSVSDLIEWIARQSWKAFQQRGFQTPVFATARSALVQNVQGAKDVYFDAEYGEVIVEFENGTRQPFNNLSDGQRCMLAVVGDLARKAATLNPHLGDRVLLETSGVVMIDELDLHLHPKWQRQVIEDLRTTFPKLQFICTTHSPFLIQALRSGEELIMLEGQPTANLGDLPLEDIARGIQGVSNPQVSARYQEMKQVARTYLETLEEAQMAPEEKLEEYQKRLADSIAPYADNPAFQAFLEMKRAAKLGE